MIAAVHHHPEPDLAAIARGLSMISRGVSQDMRKQTPRSVLRRFAAPVLCGCGCGTSIAAYRKGRRLRFAHGHAALGLGKDADAAVLAHLRSVPDATTREIMRTTKCSVHTVQNSLGRLRDRRQVAEHWREIGRGQATHWVATAEGTEADHG